MKCHSPGPLRYMYVALVCYCNTIWALGSMYIFCIWVDYPFEGATFPWTDNRIGSGRRNKELALCSLHLLHLRFGFSVFMLMSTSWQHHWNHWTTVVTHSVIQINQTCLSSGSLVRLLRQQNPRRTVSFSYINVNKSCACAVFVLARF